MRSSCSSAIFTDGSADDVTRRGEERFGPVDIRRRTGDSRTGLRKGDGCSGGREEKGIAGSASPKDFCVVYLC
jgi:hypothetical protein